MNLNELWVKEVWTRNLVGVHMKNWTESKLTHPHPHQTAPPRPAQPHQPPRTHHHPPNPLLFPFFPFLYLVPGDIYADCWAYKRQLFHAIWQLKIHVFFENRMSKKKVDSIRLNATSIRSCKFSSSAKSRNQTSHSNHLSPASSSSCNDCTSYSSSNATIHL